MHARKKALTRAAALAAGLLLTAACSSGGSGGKSGSAGAGLDACTKAGKADTCNSAPTKKGGTYTYVLEKNIQQWNVQDTNGNTFENAEAITPVLPGVFMPQPDYSVKLNTDLVTSATQTRTNPQTLVYKINPKAKWNDGVPVSADDFVYYWRTNNGKDCKAPPASDSTQTKGCLPQSTAGYDRIKSVTGSDGGKTVTVVMTKPYSDWKALFGAGYPLYPAHYAEKLSGAESGAADKMTSGQMAKAWQFFNKTPPSKYPTAGPYRMKSWKDNDNATYVPDPKWWGAKKPGLDRLVFKVISDATQEPTALKNNEVQAIYPQPEVDLVNQVKQIPKTTYTIGHGLNWEHFDFNLHNPILGKHKELRQAIFTAIDTKAMIAKTVGQVDKSIKPLGNHFFVPGEDGYKDVVSGTGQGTGDLAKAKQLLKKGRFTGIGSALKTPDGKAVNFNCRYTTGNAIRQSECQILQSEMSKLGIKISIKPIGAADLGTTLAGHQYDIIVFAWVSAPFPTSGAQQTSYTGGGGNYGGYSSKAVDTLLDEAIGTTDSAKAADLLDQADAKMASDAYVLPLYQKPTMLVTQKRFANMRDNATNVGPPYNVGEWGLRK